MSGGQWRRDPARRYEYRWWDGDHFTEWVATNGEQMVDPGSVPTVPTTIEVGFGSSDRQNRWIVGFRLILAIPHFVWISLVTIAAFFVLIVGWFAALFTAQLPTGIARFLARVLQYHVRLLAYVYLLRDDYPPFRLSDDTYPVHVDCHPGRLNRAAVLFRLILALPVLVLSNWVSTGLAVSMVVIWIIVLAKGRMPGIAAQAVAAVVRFEARAYGYTMLLTSAYPGGLYGDQVPYAGELEGAAPATDGPPRTASVYLAKGARRLVTLFLVLGILLNIANNVANIRLDDEDRAARAPVSHQTPSSSSSSFSSSLSSSSFT